MSDQPRPLPDNTQRSQDTDIHCPGGIRTRNPSERKATDPRLRPRDRGILPSDTVCGLRGLVLSIRNRSKVYQRTCSSWCLSTISVVESMTTISGHHVYSAVYCMTGNILVRTWKLS